MKNSYIILIVLVVLAIGGWFIFGMGKKAEAPVSETSVPDGSVSGAPLSSDTNPTNTATNTNTGVTVTGTVGAYQPPQAPTVPPAAPASSVKEFTVEGKNFSFTPSTITVKKGDKVKITFKNTGGFHDFRIDEFGVATKQAQAPDTEVLEFTADKTGSFQYYCSVGSHRSMGMWGTLKVQ